MLKATLATRIAALSLVSALPCLAQAQGRSGANPNSQEPALAKPVDWGTFEARIFKDTEMKIKFTLQTSWIPGENRKGMFRYRMSVFPDPLVSYSPDDIEKIISRVNACNVTLDLFDADGFVLRTLTVPFSFGVNDKARVQSLFANTASQMDSNEYRQFVGSANHSGSWSIGWACLP
jgi:hypothetical protein